MAILSNCTKITAHNAIFVIFAIGADRYPHSAPSRRKAGQSVTLSAGHEIIARDAFTQTKSAYTIISIARGDVAVTLESCSSQGSSSTGLLDVYGNQGASGERVGRPREIAIGSSPRAKTAFSSARECSFFYGVGATLSAAFADGNQFLESDAATAQRGDGTGDMPGMY